MCVLLIAINCRFNGPVTRRRHDTHASTCSRESPSFFVIVGGIGPTIKQQSFRHHAWSDHTRFLPVDLSTPLQHTPTPP